MAAKTLVTRWQKLERHWLWLSSAKVAWQVLCGTATHTAANIPVGNILLSAAILCAGATASKVLRVFRHIGVSCITTRTFFRHQNNVLIPAVHTLWDQQQKFANVPLPCTWGEAEVSDVRYNNTVVSPTWYPTYPCSYWQVYRLEHRIQYAASRLIDERPAVDEHTLGTCLALYSKHRKLYSWLSILLNSAGGKFLSYTFLFISELTL